MKYDWSWGIFLEMSPDGLHTYLQTLLMVAFCMAPLLIMIKIISRLFLSGFKGKSVSFIETAFFFYYIFLTVEARAEWRCYIEEQKKS